MLAANRVGKTEGVGGYELTLHLTGDYPSWWVGRRFSRPIKAWVAGDTGTTVRDILQAKLFGPFNQQGTGLIPSDNISRITRGMGKADTIDTAYIKHKAGGVSQLTFKSYDQRRESFQGTEQDVIWLDEEPPLGIYTECLLRTMTNNGMIMLTFTPLLGMSEVVLQFLPGGQLSTTTNDGSRYVVMATWDDAPHLEESAKAELWQSIPAFQRDARSKGIPQLGAGAIYPVPEESFVVEPFEIPAHWPKGYGMDVGWNWTAAIWGAKNRETGVTYLYNSYKRQHAEPSVHAAGIRAAGAWIPGFIDPASRARTQKDGTQLIADYRELGLILSIADNGVESGLLSVWERLSSGRYKMFKGLSNILEEMRLYRRDETGKVVKVNDHLMDAWRYLDSRIDQFSVKPVEHIEKPPVVYLGEANQGWMS